MSKDVQTLLDQLPPYQGKKKLIKSRQFTYDIINDILRKHKQTVKEYDAICGRFWKGDTDTTAQELYFFAKRHLPYQMEPTLTQTSKTLAAILEERNTYGNDCKHYASLCIGVGEALRRQGYPVKCFYRFASYNQQKRAPGHVFAVFVDETGKEIWVDPVPETGGYNKRYIKPVYTTDKMPPMSKNGNSIGDLYDISGIATNRTVAGLRPNQTIGHMHWLDALPVHGRIMHKARHNKYDDFDEIGKIKLKIKAPHIKIQPGKLIKKLVGAAPRNAYMALLKLNAFDMAVSIHNKIVNNPASWKKLHDFWQSVGGDPNKLSTAINGGVNTYNKLHPKHKVSGLYDNYTDGIGIVAVAGAAALLAAAAPIIKAIQGVLKSIGVDHTAVKNASDKADVDVAQDHNDATATPGDGNADVQADGSVKHKHGVKTKVKKDASGNQTMEMSVADPTAGASGGGAPDASAAPGDGGAADADPGDGGDADADAGDDSDADPGDGTSKTKTVTKTKTKDGGGGDIKTMLANVTGFVSDHKVWFIGGAVVLLSIIIIPKLIHRGPKRRR